MSKIAISEHYKQRFYERQAKTKRIQLFTQRAYFYGKTANETRFGKYTKNLENKEKIYNSEAKIYNGFIYWFSDNKAITIYPLPNKLRAKQTNKQSHRGVAFYLLFIVSIFFKLHFLQRNCGFLSSERSYLPHETIL